MKRFLSFTLLLALMLSIFSLSHALDLQVGNVVNNSYIFPIRASFAYSYTQQIYAQPEINFSGPITKLRFYYASGDMANSSDWTIYMGHTIRTAFDSNADWVALSDLTEVFDGDVGATPASAGWMEITLNTPFVYDNVNNLVIAVHQYTPGLSSTEVRWGSFFCNTDVSLAYYDDIDNPNPASPPTATYRSIRKNCIQLVFPEPVAPVDSYPWTENFDSTAAGEMPDGWTVIASQSGADYRGWTTDAAIGGSSEPHVACVRRHTIYPKDEWMITLPFLMQEGESYTISFKVRAPGSGGMGEALALRWGTAPTVASMTSNPPLYDDTQIRFGYWTEISEEFIPPSSGVYYFGWYAYSPANLRYIAVDDITIDLSPGLVPPVVSVSISGSNVVLSWDPVPGANFYYIYASEDPYNFGSTPIAGIDNNQFVVPANLAKRFFRVTSGVIPCKSFGGN